MLKLYINVMMFMFIEEQKADQLDAIFRPQDLEHDLQMLR